MVLLELGSQRSLSQMKKQCEKQSGEGWNAGAFRNWVVNQVLGGLSVRIGDIYTNAVKCCLKGLDSHERVHVSFQEAFYNKVVKKTEMCVV